jgi:DNA polymerase-3 subunit delta
MLGDNLSRVPDETDLIIVATKPDKRTKTYKTLLKSAKSREFPMLKPPEMKNWLFDETRQLGIKIDALAVNELLGITGGDSDQQARLSAEIAKFQTLGQPVTVDLVRKIVEPNLTTNAFEILNLALNGKRREMAAEIKNLRESGEDANKFLGLLASQIFALSAAVFASTGLAKEVAGDLKIHPFQLARMRDLADQLGSDSQRKIRKITKILADADAGIKLSRADEAWVLIEMALAKIIS